MPNFGAGDVQSLMAEMGVSVVLDADTTLGLVDRAYSRMAEGAAAGLGESAIIGRTVTVTVQTGKLTALAIGAALTVDGEAFVVSSILAIEDGELTRISCAKS